LQLGDVEGKVNLGLSPCSQDLTVGLGLFFQQEDYGGKKEPGKPLQGLMLTDLAGEMGANPVVSLDAALPEGMPGKISVPEILEDRHFWGQGGAVGRGGNEAKPPFFFSGDFLLSLLMGGFLRGRQLQLYG
jgi:hypothetical protein